MSISVTALIPNQTIPASLAAGGVSILSGIAECVFKGDSGGDIVRDSLTFSVGPVNFPGADTPPIASAVISPASVAFDGTVNSVLWAVDSAEVSNFVNIDSGSGTARLQVTANLAIRGSGAVILRVNYVVFYSPEIPA